MNKFANLDCAKSQGDDTKPGKAIIRARQSNGKRRVGKAIKWGQEKRHEGMIRG